MNYLSTDIKTSLIPQRPYLTGLFISLFCLLMSYHPASAQNYCLSFDGSNDYVAVSPVPTFNSTTTVEAWIKIVKPSGYAIAEPNIFSWGADANSVEFRLGLSGNNATLQFGIDATGSSGGAWQAISGSTNINTGNWVHVAVVKNGTTSTLYINGVSEVSGTISRSPALNTCTIGNLNEHGSQQNRYFPGLIDEVRIWNTARSQAEIQANMNNELAGTETGLTNYYKMTNGSNTTLTDNKGSSTGTISGATWTQPDAFPVQLFVSDVYAASYATVKGAFDAINAGTHTGAIKLKLTASTNEIATAALYQSGYTGSGGTSSYSSVNLFPTVTGLSIAGNLAAPLIDLNGADNVTINGSLNGANAGKDLTITNTSTANTTGTSTIRFINDASINTVKYCTVKGSTTDASSGILFFSTGSSTGNITNTIDNNNITNAADANRPLNAIYSLGSSSAENSGNIISNNNIYDFLNRGINSYGIKLLAYTTAFTISGNSFYEINSFHPTTGDTSHYLISIENTTGTNFIISNNYMGGSSPNCGTGGTVSSWTKTNEYNNFFYGIYLNVDAGTNSIQGNTMKNFYYSNPGFCAWAGIFTLGAGDLNIGNTTGNTIGESTGNGSITFTGGWTNSNFYGYYIQNTGTVNIQNNAISSILASNATSTNAINFIGIYKSQSGTTNISNNMIGSTTTANSIHVSSASSSNAQTVYGIKCEGTGANTISGNTIANLTNATSYTTGSVVTGLHYNGSTTASTVSKNLIHSLAATGGATTADVYGIRIDAGSATYSNNIISLGGNTTTVLVGIWESGTNNSLYFNTLYIGGTLSTGSTGINSHALWSTQSNTRDFKNNIFYNARSNASGATGYNIAMDIPNGTNLTCDYNAYYASGTGGYIGFYNGALTNSMPIVTGQDAQSLNTNPSFASPGGTLAANYATSASLPGITISGITTDYFGTTRDATPKMGAYEGSTCANPTNGGTIGTSQTICSGFVPAAFSSTALPTGHNGTLEYKWQKSTTSASSDFADIASSNSATYASGALTATTWYNRLSKVTCDATWPEAGESNVVQVTVNSPSFTPGTFKINDLHATGSTEGAIIKWYAGSTGGDPLATDFVLVNTHHYYASQTVNGVESTARMEVTATIDPTPCAPSGTAAQNFCFAATVADLTATVTGSNVRWYTTSGGVTALSPTTVLSAGTYFATQTINCTESTSRLAVAVTLAPLPTPSIGGPGTGHVATPGYIYNATNATGTKLWTVTGGTILEGQGTDSITVQWTSTGTQTITVQITNGSCEITNSIQVSVTPSL